MLRMQSQFYYGICQKMNRVEKSLYVNFCGITRIIVNYVFKWRAYNSLSFHNRKRLLGIRNNVRIIWPELCITNYEQNIVIYLINLLFTSAEIRSRANIQKSVGVVFAIR